MLNLIYKTLLHHELGDKHMNYERIILELLERIQILEDKVEALERNCQGEAPQNSNDQPAKKTNLTAGAKAYIIAQKAEAKQKGLSEIILVCNDIQKALGAINRAPAICSAMYDCMAEGDEVLFAPPSGKSTTVKIRYYV